MGSMQSKITRALAAIEKKTTDHGLGEQPTLGLEEWAEALPAGLMAVDPQGVIIYLNGLGERALFGESPMVGSFAVQVAGHIGPEGIELSAPKTQKGTQLLLRLVSPDGDFAARYFFGRSSELNEATHTLYVFQDSFSERGLSALLEREHVPDALGRQIQEQVRIQVEQRVKSLGKDLTHHVNNPLAFVHANAEYVQDLLNSEADRLPIEDLKQAIAEIVEGTKRIRTTIQSLAQHGRVERDDK